MLAIYSGQSSCGSAVLIVDRARNIFHCWCQISKESLNSSMSSGGGTPYGLNGLGGMAGHGLTQDLGDTRESLNTAQRVAPA